MCVIIRIASMRRFKWEHTIYLYIKEKRRDTLIMPPDLVLWLTLISSNYPCLEHIFMVPKVFEPLKFYCMSELYQRVLWDIVWGVKSWLYFEICFYFQQCSDGTYASAQGMSACETCPAGKYCLPVVPANASLNAQDCPAGYFCPEGKL